jgi:hypothetical protein
MRKSDQTKLMWPPQLSADPRRHWRALAAISAESPLKEQVCDSSLCHITASMRPPLLAMRMSLECPHKQTDAKHKDLPANGRQDQLSCELKLRSLSKAARLASSTRLLFCSRLHHAPSAPHKPLPWQRPPLPGELYKHHLASQRPNAQCVATLRERMRHFLRLACVGLQRRMSSTGCMLQQSTQAAVLSTNCTCTSAGSCGQRSPAGSLAPARGTQ